MPFNAASNSSSALFLSQRTSTQAFTSPGRLTASCRDDNPAIRHYPFAAATTAKPAAGTVVTEMNTPTKAADFEETSASVPAAPARSATTNEMGQTLYTKSTSWSDSRMTTCIHTKTITPNVPARATPTEMEKPTQAQRIASPHTHQT